MKEIKVYIDELPEDCTDCPCYDFDIGGCQCKDPHFTYQSIDRFKGCPLIDIKVHDRELVKEVCEKIREYLRTQVIYCGGKATELDIMIANAGNQVLEDVKQFLDQIQKEYEK